MAADDTIEVEPEFCDGCGLLVWADWPTGVACDDEGCAVEHECNPDS